MLNDMIAAGKSSIRSNDIIKSNRSDVDNHTNDIFNDLQSHHDWLDTIIDHHKEYSNTRNINDNDKFVLTHIEDAFKLDQINRKSKIKNKLKESNKYNKKHEDNEVHEEDEEDDNDLSHFT